MSPVSSNPTTPACFCPATRPASRHVWRPSSRIPGPRTVTLEVTPRFLGENYVFGVFANGRDIPSPHFEECPQITPLSLGDTQAPQVPEADSADDRVWYRAELEEGQYRIDATASRIDGASSNIIYETFLIDGFGQGTSQQALLDVNEVGVTVSDTASFTRTEDGPVWLRLDVFNAGLGVEFTVEAAGGS